MSYHTRGTIEEVSDIDGVPTHTKCGWTRYKSDVSRQIRKYEKEPEQTIFFQNYADPEVEEMMHLCQTNIQNALI